MLRELIASSIEPLANLSKPLTDILVDHQLNAHKKGNAFKDIQALIRETLLPQIQETINKINSDKSLKNLYEAYADCIVYGTSPNTAASDHEVDAADLAWLLAYKRLSSEEISVSKSLKKLREKRK